MKKKLVLTLALATLVFSGAQADSRLAISVTTGSDGFNPPSAFNMSHGITDIFGMTGIGREALVDVSQLRFPNNAGNYTRLKKISYSGQYQRESEVVPEDLYWRKRVEFEAIVYDEEGSLEYDEDVRGVWQYEVQGDLAVALAGTNMSTNTLTLPRQITQDILPVKVFLD